MKIRRIESRDNASLKLARKVRDGKEGGQIFVEGLRLAEEAIRSDLPVKLAIVREGYGTNPRAHSLLKTIIEKRLEVIETSARIFSTVADTSSSQGIVLIADRATTDRSSFENVIDGRLSPVPLFVSLLETNDPSNVGAVLRTAEAAGISGVIISKNSSDVFSPKTLRASMGSAFRLPIWSGASHADLFDWARKRDLRIAATSARESTYYTSLDWKEPRLLVMGSEAHGLSEEILADVDEKIAIPMQSSVESLNLSVAAGVLMFEARRQTMAKKH